MPIREFKCPDCERIVERIIRNDNTTIVTCSHCEFPEYNGTHIMEPIQYSVGAFHLHGSRGGWKNPSMAAKRVVNPDNVGWE